MDWLDDDYAYFITKTLHECHEELAKRTDHKTILGMDKNLKCSSSGTPPRGSTPF